jgi:UDPglucose--hexose-1-phosphate uridylyltransferase
MPELRKDPLLPRWVIIAPERAERPHAFLMNREDQDVASCPFCPGNEAFTTTELYALREMGTPFNGPGWRLRVIPNRFPALRIEIEPRREAVGLFDLHAGTGAHEVIIETDDHHGSLASLPVPRVVDVLRAWQVRMLDLSRDLRLRYAQIFKNTGTPAGATLAHPHSQLIALPVLPEELAEELKTCRAHWERKERCLLCDLVAQELAEDARVVYKSEQVLAVAPYASRSPFEVHLYPRAHRAAFEHAPPWELTALAEGLRTVLKKVDVALESPAYNLYLQSMPLREPVDTPWYHYRLVLKPTLTQPGGFEWGTGFHINPTPPEEAARFLRQTEVKP